jgi:hypothetical protein
VGGLVNVAVAVEDEKLWGRVNFPHNPRQVRLQLRVSFSNLTILAT